jgi:hypothetical protein
VANVTWGWIAVMLAIVLGNACDLAGPGPPHRQEFGNLSTADRIELSISRAEGLRYVTDRAEIRRAAAFFERYREGWVTMPSGGGAPVFLRFLRAGEDIGTFGVAPGALSVGSSTRYVPDDEIAEMIRGLGIDWPREH